MSYVVCLKLIQYIWQLYLKRKQNTTALPLPHITIVFNLKPGISKLCDPHTWCRQASILVMGVLISKDTRLRIATRANIITTCEAHGVFTGTWQAQSKSLLSNWHTPFHFQPYPHLNRPGASTSSGPPGGFPESSAVENLPANTRALGLIWVTRILWRRKRQPTPVFLPGEPHRQRNLAGYSHGVAKSWTWFSDWKKLKTMPDTDFPRRSWPQSGQILNSLILVPTGYPPCLGGIHVFVSRNFLPRVLRTNTGQRAGVHARARTHTHTHTHIRNGKSSFCSGDSPPPEDWTPRWETLSWRLRTLPCVTPLLNWVHLMCPPKAPPFYRIKGQ